MARGFSPPVTDGAWLPQILGKSPRPSGYIVRSSGPVSDWREPSVHLLINLQSLHSRINSGVDGEGPLCGTPRASSSNTITWFDGHVVRFVSAHRDSITATSPRLDNCRRVLYIQTDSGPPSGIVSQVSSPRCSVARLPAGISARRGQCCPSPGICHGFLACLVNGLLSFGRILVGPSRHSTSYYTTGRGASPIAYYMQAIIGCAVYGQALRVGFLVRFLARPHMSARGQDDHGHAPKGSCQDGGRIWNYGVLYVV